MWNEIGVVIKKKPCFANGSELNYALYYKMWTSEVKILHLVRYCSSNSDIPLGVLRPQDFATNEFMLNMTNDENNANIPLGRSVFIDYSRGPASSIRFMILTPYYIWSTGYKKDGVEILHNTLEKNVFAMSWKFFQGDDQRFNLLRVICAKVGVPVPKFDGDNETFESSLEIANTIRTLELKVSSAFPPINPLSITERLSRLATHHNAWPVQFLKGTLVQQEAEH